MKTNQSECENGTTKAADTTRDTADDTVYSESAPGTTETTTCSASAPATAGTTICSASAPGTAGTTISGASAPATAGTTISGASAPATAGTTTCSASAPATAGTTTCSAPAPGTAGTTISSAPAPGTAGTTISSAPAPGTAGTTISGATTAIDVIDAAGGNVGSLCRALERLGVTFTRVNAECLPTGDKPVILPGVGNFGAVMKRLRDAKLDTRIRDLVNGGVPFLGVCVGLQVLFEGSEESPGVPGLSLLNGNVVKFTAGKVPQIGWNRIESTDSSWASGFAYFVNSYFAVPAQEDVVLYQSEYFQPFCAAVQKNNITAFQFHPEKSGAFGMTLLERWIDDARI